MRGFKLITLLACLLAGTVGGASAALAARNQSVLFEAPQDLLNPQTRPAALGKLDSLGVHALRVILLWHGVAPAADSRVRPTFDATDPAGYNWGQYDALLAAAQQRGWQVLLTISGPVPRWATPRGVDTVTRPDAREFQRFATAVGRHYGKQVKLFSIWNEPNHPEFLGPQYVNRVPKSPLIYRSLFQAGYAGLQASGNFNGAKVLLGETAPRGTGHDVAPLTFLRGALCLDSHYRKASTCSALPADGYAHHAYTTRAGPFFKPSEPNDVTIAVLSRLTRALDLAGRAHALPAHLPIYLTEFGIQSFPDPFNGVSLAQQAEFDGIAEHIAYTNRRVRFFSQYLLRDEPRRKGNVFQRNGGFDTGLELAGGKPKPSFTAWPIPLAVTRRGSGVSLWGLVRPTVGATQVELDVADGRHAFRRLLLKRTNSLGYWAAHSSYRRGRRWRVRWSAPSGALYTGPPIRAYTAAGALQR